VESCRNCGVGKGLFSARKRLNDAGRVLRMKETKKAKDDVWIAGNDIDRAMWTLSDLKCT